ncbi:MAG: alpha/beta fold hydrolase [Gemmatimonadota bacterium]
MTRLLLLHGWDHRNYTRRGCGDAWENRSVLVQGLARHFDVIRFNFPGFCGEPDPPRPWRMEDFVELVDGIVRRESPDVALGYSFGGAVLLAWKHRSGDRRVRGVLVSPAIVRRYEGRSVSLPDSVRRVVPDAVRDWGALLYLRLRRRNPYYTRATRVMRRTYRNIVALDLRDRLRQVDHPLCLIYGERDTATPPGLVADWLDRESLPHRLHVIPGGDHDIGGTHTEQVVRLVRDCAGTIS